MGNLHVRVVVDGIVLDAFENRPDRCIYAAWEIKGSIPTNLS